MKIIDVKLPHHQYEIKIGSGLLECSASHIAPFLKRNFVAIVTDETVGALYLEGLKKCLSEAGVASAAVTVPSGEKSKNWNTLGEVVEGLLAAKVERDDVIIALGGGVIGDLVGFAAAILRRGVRFIQMPTTLLAQVDSSVGGKTGINSPVGKNLIGAFHQPELVLADIDVLQTLEKREFLAGYGEVVKYGLLGDERFFSWCEENAQSIRTLEDAALISMIGHCCQMKADIVARDEKEHGDRALLNLGHTFGHALEKVTGYSGRLLHGEGVAIGCALAFDLSARLGYSGNNLAARVRSHLDIMGMKSSMQDIDGQLPPAEEVLSAMYQDKKVKAGSLTFVLVHEIGHAFVARGVDASPVLELLKEQY